MSRKRRLMAGVGMVTLLAGPAYTAAAQESTAGSPSAAEAALEARTVRVASSLRCPVCQGLSIEDSPSPLAIQMKDLIRSQLAAGRSEEEVTAYFVSRYGEWVLLEPPAAGFNLVVYLLPLVAFLAGAAVIALAVRRWTAAPLARSEAGR
ncbi:MAG TPA: cytochrome c-type biogenesis protein [Longimicrobiales bacterium]|nr:cytochrome c-type biogenesis protein [Longimicrobiales bacterium]